MDTEFDMEPVYGDVDRYLKTKIKMYDDKANTNFQGKEVPKENASNDCLSQPRPQSNFKKITLEPHDFAGNFYLI